MAEISYRPYQEGDAEDVTRILIEAMNIHRFVQGERLRHTLADAYRCERLLASSFTQVAVQDGRTLGIVMGHVTGVPRLPGRFRHRLRSAWLTVLAGVLGFRQWKSLARYAGFEAVYRRLRATHASQIPNELTLFAVDASTRGHGVGTHLYASFTRHLEKRRQHSFFLFTDDTLSYRFYEKMGMTRRGTAPHSVLLDGQLTDIEVYLYTHDLTGQSRSAPSQGEH